MEVVELLFFTESSKLIKTKVCMIVRWVFVCFVFTDNSKLIETTKV